MRFERGGITGRTPASRMASLPRVDFSGAAGEEFTNNRLTRLRAKDHDTLGLPRYDSSLTIRQLLLDGGAIESRIESARASSEAALHRLNDVGQRVALLAVEVYVEVLRARASLARAEVRAPLDGVVKQVKIATVGGAVRPGMDLVEIVPLEGTLIVEARVLPADIAFLRPGLAARIKLSAYDYAIYGALDGEIDWISADSIVDERGDVFYLVRASSQAAALVVGDRRFPIIAGMTATVDVLTGRKTVLEYLLKPIRRTKDYALREQ